MTSRPEKVGTIKICFFEKMLKNSFVVFVALLSDIREGLGMGREPLPESPGVRGGSAPLLTGGCG